jgi:hypothetical protein
MTVLPWALALLLTVGVAGLVLVPWLRPAEAHGARRPASAEEVEAALRAAYCLACGERWEGDADRCSSCGAPRGEDPA